MPYVVERIVAQGRALNKDRVFIPTSFQSKELIVNAQLLLGDVDQYPVIDVTIDGADEVDETLNCVKGGGACHLREKVLAEAADTFILVADYRKNSDVLGKNVRLPFHIPSLTRVCSLAISTVIPSKMVGATGCQGLSSHKPIWNVSGPREIGRGVEHRRKKSRARGCHVWTKVGIEREVA